MTGIQALREQDGLHGGSHGPPIDVRRRGDEFVIEVDLPGIDVDAVAVTVDEGALTIRAERPVGGRDDDLLLAERPRGSIARWIPLGTSIDASKVEAVYTNGVLTLTVPVRETAKSQRIDIKGAGGRPSSPPLDDPAPSEPPEPDRPDESAKLPPY